MEIEFVGAAGEVTGSKHLVRTERATLLLDCGLVQGRRSEATQRNRELGIDPRAIDAVVLSHAHLDHSGALPRLTRHGYHGPIFTTSATRSLCAAMLADSAHIQQADARFLAKLARRTGAAIDAEPLYDEDDVTGVLAAMTAVPYHRAVPIAPGVTLTFFDAGHVLGSAVVALDIEESTGASRLVFSGDLGRTGAPLLRDPEVPPGANWLLLESTYGDRNHASIGSGHEMLQRLVQRTVERGGKVLIPAFALERAQEVLYSLHELWERGALPRVPVYVDSPLTLKVTDVFRMHPECLDDEVRAKLRRGSSPFDFPGLEYVEDKSRSQVIDADPRPCIVIAASGMCEGGRVVHHLRAMLGDPRNLVLMVGYQAQHTLGRRLVERRSSVRIFGLDYQVRAEIAELDAFSAHAGQDELVGFVRAVAARGDLRRIFLVHGEPAARRALAGQLHQGDFAVEQPRRGQRFVCPPA